MLYAAVYIHTNKHAVENLEQCYVLGDVRHLFMEISCSDCVSVLVLYVASLCWRPKRPPHQDGQPGTSLSHIQHVFRIHSMYLKLQFHLIFVFYPHSHQAEVQVLTPCCPIWIPPDHKVRISPEHSLTSLSVCSREMTSWCLSSYKLLLNPSGHPNLGPMQRMGGPRGMGPMGPGPQVGYCSTHIEDRLHIVLLAWLWLW